MPQLVKEIESKTGDKLYVISGDTYVFNSEDFYDMVALFKDPAVYKYITEDTLKKYYDNLDAPELLAADFLHFMSVKWHKNNEHRFFVRDHVGHIVGIIGYDIRPKNLPELWYYKSSKSPSFMSLALPRILEFMRDQDFAETFALVEPENKASIHLLEKLGFINRGVIKEESKELVKLSKQFK